MCGAARNCAATSSGFDGVASAAADARGARRPAPPRPDRPAARRRSPRNAPHRSASAIAVSAHRDLPDLIPPSTRVRTVPGDQATLAPRSTRAAGRASGAAGKPGWRRRSPSFQRTFGVVGELLVDRLVDLAGQQNPSTPMIAISTSIAGEMKSCTCGHGEHDEDQEQRRRHEQAEQVAPRVDDVADVAAHRALVARQQVVLVAGHHLLAAVGHRGPALQLLGLALLLGQRRPRISLRRLRASAVVIGAGATGPRRLRGLAALGVGLPLGAVVPDRARSPATRRRLGLRRVAVVVLAAQQLHACQVTSPAAPARHAPRDGRLYPAGMTQPAGADRPGLLRRQPHRGRGRRRHRRGLAPGPARRPVDRWPRSPTAARASSTCWPAGSASVRHSRVSAARWPPRSTPSGSTTPRTSTAYIECAQACGLALLGGPPTVQTAVAAHSRGRRPARSTPRWRRARPRIVVGLGGSACTDGGRGLVDALGGLRRARDAAGRGRADRRHRRRAPAARADGSRARSSARRRAPTRRPSSCSRSG